MILVASISAAADEIAHRMVERPDVLAQGPVAVKNLVQECLRNHTSTWGDGGHRPVILNGRAYDVDNKLADYIAELRAENKSLKAELASKWRSS